MFVSIVPSFPAYNPFWSFCTSCQCILMYLVHSYVAAWPSEVFAAFQVEAKQRGPDSPVAEIDWLHWVHFPTVGFGRTSACPSGEKSNITFASLSVGFQSSNSQWMFKWMLQLESPHLKLQARPSETFVQPYAIVWLFVRSLRCTIGSQCCHTVAKLRILCTSSPLFPINRPTLSLGSSHVMVYSSSRAPANATSK